MSVSLEYLERCSAGSNFQITALEKVVRLGEVAANIARHPFLGKVLALKGGTGLNLCFGPPQRLSVDLDFNYIGQVERDGMLSDRPKVEEAVHNIARRAGYRVQHTADAFAGRKIFLIYRSVLGQEERIEIDLNFLFRVSLTGTKVRTIWQPGDLDRPKLKVVGLEELLIGKLLALLDRGAARDVWDVAHFKAPMVDVLESNRFRAYFIALAGILDHPFPTYTRERLKKLITTRTVEAQLTPMLMIGTAPQIEELIDSAWTRVMPFLSLTSRENEYLSSVSNGEVRMELLFSNDTAESSRISRHPAILWKIHNVCEHLNNTKRQEK